VDCWENHRSIMSPDEQIEWMDACAAMLAGEPIEFRSSLTGVWIGATNIEAGRPHRRKPPAPVHTLIPLGPDDLLGCVLRERKGSVGYFAIFEVTGLGLFTMGKFVSFGALQADGWLIHRLGEIDADGKPIWKRCEKEAE